MKLREIAHCRAGDKGNTSNISVIPYDENHYEYLKQNLTIETVKAAFKDIVQGDIVRYDLPNIHAFNFVLYDALGGGVTTTLSMDIHGKSLSSIMCNINLPDIRD
ncbi:hypothetical protein [Bacillus dakarensis]|uniref:AtuA-related protein n=1 Tax=Robertmurraya dakarensis TaxID=1926278 RepID=UPI000982563A|nr:hypothetical protein [Bacillus dakarensis]